MSSCLHFAGGHICDHIRAESEPSCCRFPSQQCLNSTMSLISRTAGTEGVWQSVWCFSRWLEAWPKKPQYGAAYLVMNAVISVHGTYHPVLILKDGNLHCVTCLDWAQWEEGQKVGSGELAFFGYG